MDFIYSKKLRKKDLKKISKVSCNDEIKEYYIKYLTNFSFESFVDFYNNFDDDIEIQDIILDFLDSEVKKYEAGSIKWLSTLILSLMVYFDINLDVIEYNAAFISILQTILHSVALKSIADEIPYYEVQFPKYADECLVKFFNQCGDFEYNLENDCYFTYKSSEVSNLSFTQEEFFEYVKKHFDEMNYAY